MSEPQRANDLETEATAVAPWWVTGTAPEVVFTGRWRRRRLPLLVACAVSAAALLGFFVWIGVAAHHA